MKTYKPLNVNCAISKADCSSENPHVQLFKGYEVREAIQESLTVDNKTRVDIAVRFNDSDSTGSYVFAMGRGEADNWHNINTMDDVVIAFDFGYAEIVDVRKLDPSMFVNKVNTLNLDELFNDSAESIYLDARKQHLEAHFPKDNSTNVIDDIGTMAAQLVMIDENRLNYENIFALRSKGFYFIPCETDSFGILTAVLVWTDKHSLKTYAVFIA